MSHIHTLFVTYTIIQSITSSEMCSLHLSHPSAHTPGAVDTHTHLEQWTHTHTWSSGHTHTPGAVDTHTHLEQWTHTHTWSSGHTHTPGAVDTHTHLEQWTHRHTWSSGHTHTPGAVDTHTHLEQWTHTHSWSSGHTHTPGAVDTHTHTPGAVGRSIGEQLGVRCRAQGSLLSRGQFLPEPRFEPTTSSYKSDALSIRATTAPRLFVIYK